MKPEYGSHPMTQRQPSQIDSPKCTIIQELLNEPGNDCCADCNQTLTIDNAWAVLSYGIFVCDDCKLVHIEHENYNFKSETNGTTESTIKGEQGEIILFSFIILFNFIFIYFIILIFMLS